VCKSCGQHFVFQPKAKNRVKTTSLKDWKRLHRGQRIKVLQGYGPYYVAEDGERISVGSNGVFTVRFIDSKGIGVYGVNGFCFINMVKRRDTHNIGIVYEPHKLELVK
jgi:hypothetical protein